MIVQTCWVYIIEEQNKYGRLAMVVIHSYNLVRVLHLKLARSADEAGQASY